MEQVLKENITYGNVNQTLKQQNQAIMSEIVQLVTDCRYLQRSIRDTM